MKCPVHDLADVLYWFNPVSRERVSEEPSFSEATSYAGTSEEAWEDYMLTLKLRTDARRAEKAAMKYGKTLEEIIRNLKPHVRSHLSCRREYLRIVWAESSFLYQMLGEMFGRSPLSILMEIDVQYLGLFGEDGTGHENRAAPQIFNNPFFP